MDSPPRPGKLAVFDSRNNKSSLATASQISLTGRNVTSQVLQSFLTSQRCTLEESARRAAELCHWLRDLVANNSEVSDVPPGDRCIPTRVFQAMVEKGIFSMLLPEQNGGLAMHLKNVLVVLETLASLSLPLALLVHQQVADSFFWLSLLKNIEIGGNLLGDKKIIVEAILEGAKTAGVLMPEAALWADKSSPQRSTEGSSERKKTVLALTSAPQYHAVMARSENGAWKLFLLDSRQVVVTQNTSNTSAAGGLPFRTIHLENSRQDASALPINDFTSRDLAEQYLELKHLLASVVCLGVIKRSIERLTSSGKSIGTTANTEITILASKALGVEALIQTIYDSLSTAKGTSLPAATELLAIARSVAYETMQEATQYFFSDSECGDDDADVSAQKYSREARSFGQISEISASEYFAELGRQLASVPSAEIGLKSYFESFKTKGGEQSKRQNENCASIFNSICQYVKQVFLGSQGITPVHEHMFSLLGKTVASLVLILSINALKDQEVESDCCPLIEPAAYWLLNEAENLANQIRRLPVNQTQFLMSNDVLRAVVGANSQAQASADSTKIQNSSGKSNTARLNSTIQSFVSCVLPPEPKIASALSQGNAKSANSSTAASLENIFAISFELSLPAANIKAIRQAAEFMVKRHDALRSDFSQSALSNGNGPTIIPANQISPIDIISRSYSSRETIAEVMAAEAENFAKHGGVLPIRFIHVTSTVDQSKLTALIVFNQSAIDEKCARQSFTAEFPFVLASFAAMGIAPPLPFPRDEGLAEYFDWLKSDYLKSDQSENDLQYWREKLAHIKEIQLPVDFKRASDQQLGQLVKYESQKIVISNEDAEGLAGIVGETKASMTVVLTAILKILLSKYAQESDLSVATVVDARPKEYADVIGSIQNTILLRSQVVEILSFRDFVQQECAVWKEALERRFLPHEQVVKEIAPHQTSDKPLVPVCVVALPACADSNIPWIKVSGDNMRGISANRKAGYDIILRITNEPNGSAPSCAFEFNSTLFKAETIARLAKHFCNILKCVVENLRILLDEISCLSAEETKAIVYDWNNTAKPIDKSEDCLLHELAIGTPAKATHIFEGDSVIYLQSLQKMANQIARFLHVNHVTPGSVVAVVMSKSHEYVASISGILQAGCVFLPLDPTAVPAAYIQDILKDSSARAFITLDATTVPKINNCFEIQFSRAVHNNLGAEQKSIILPADTTLPAYIIYTSGSTGKPKGVILHHRGVVSNLRDVIDRFHVTSRDCILCLSPIGFDLSIFDFFGLLAVGGNIVIPTANQAKEPAAWLHLIAKHHVTIWNTTPVLLNQLVSHVATNNLHIPESLRLVMLSGDWIPLTLPDRLRAHCRNQSIEIFSLGGATEASIWSVTHKIERIEPEATSICYGRPMVNQRMHILDAKLRPLPIGVPGKLYIAGVGVAHGYLKREELNKAHFFDDPFVKGGRLYYTGDMAYYAADGSIFLKGRMDTQVKVKGFRVDLKEVEEEIRKVSAAVDDCAALVTTSNANASTSHIHRCLIAFVTARSHDQISANGLRDMLKSRIPFYMIPCRIYISDNLPVTANGKIDRKALMNLERS